MTILSIGISLEINRSHFAYKLCGVALGLIGWVQDYAFDTHSLSLRDRFPRLGAKRRWRTSIKSDDYWLGPFPLMESEHRCMHVVANSLAKGYA